MVLDFAVERPAGDYERLQGSRQRLCSEIGALVGVLARMAYHGLIAVGRPIGGVRPRRIYDALGRRAYPVAEADGGQWVRNRWGHELLLSHHYHLDRNILIYGDYDHELHLLLQQRVKAGMTVLDVGANLGEMTLHMASLVGETGRVHAFEPYPPAYQRLVTHIERNRMSGWVKAWGVALSNAKGTVTMSVPGEGADNQGIGSIVNGAAGAGKREIEAMTMDGFMADRGIGKVGFVKLDIQGAELFFLEGAQETLRRDRPEVVMEVSPSDLKGIGRTSRDLLGLVEGLGYEVYEVQGGRVRRRIKAADVPGNFAAVNVLCVPGQ